MMLVVRLAESLGKILFAETPKITGISQLPDLFTFGLFIDNDINLEEFLSERDRPYNWGL